ELFFNAGVGIRDLYVTGVQTCALPIYAQRRENLPALGDLADAEVAHAMARQAAALGPAQPDAAARGTAHAGDGLDQRSLAGAVEIGRASWRARAWRSWTAPGGRRAGWW